MKPSDDDNATMAADLQSRLRQQSATAAFGRIALETRDLDHLLQEAAAQVAAGLDTRFAKVLEQLPARDRLLVRAGVGWDPGVVGVATIGADLGSPAGYALQTGQPVVSQALTKEERFRTPRILRDHGVKSMVNVIIGTPEDPYGVLEVDSPELRQFSTADVDFLTSFANLLAAAIDRQKADLLLAVRAEEKSLLLRELEHRVKNNLQVMTSLLNLQSRQTANPELRRQLQAVGGRMWALRLVHEQLFASGQVNHIDLGAHLRRLCAHLFDFHSIDPEAIRLDLRAPELIVNVDIAAPVGLLVNEFVTNSFRHAFPDQRGAVMVHLDRIEANQVRLALGDDGVGLPEMSEMGKGLGMQLIQLLAGQIDATIEWSQGPGTRASLTFPA